MTTASDVFHSIGYRSTFTPMFSRAITSPHALQHYLATSRPGMRVAFLFPLVLMGCSPGRRAELDLYKRSFYKVTFDSGARVLGTSAGNDSTRPLLEDVVEIGGRVLAQRADTVVIAPSYILIADREHPGQGRSIRRSGRQVPDVVFIPVQPGLDIEPLTESRRTSMIMPILVAVIVVSYLAFAHW